MNRRANKGPRRPADTQRLNQRRSLSNVGGVVRTQGLPLGQTLLATVMGDEMDADAARSHVHGFHAYPARMHPILARRCIELMTPQGGVVLDPFCGSGTVLVESRLAGRHAIGSDLNPLAVHLARFKTTSGCNLEDLVSSALRISSLADERRIMRKGATRRYPAQDVRLFEPHVLLELDGLRAGIEQAEPGVTRNALWLVLSSILMKVSRQTCDTSGQQTKPKRLASGFTVSLFRQKAEELARRLTDFDRYVPASAPAASVFESDARKLDRVKSASVDLVLTSPPYAGTYDYVDHHRTRLRWLGLDANRMQRNEMGARRNFKCLDAVRAARAFSDEMTHVFKSLVRVLKEGGRLVVVMADSVVGNKPIWADPLIRRCAHQAGLRWVATASQVRPHFHAPSAHAFAKRKREEHTILFAR